MAVCEYIEYHNTAKRAMPLYCASMLLAADVGEYRQGPQPLASWQG